MNDYIDKAKHFLSIHGTLSTVFLQYKLRIGYQDAKFIMQTLRL
jgi:hypothetical protein